VAVLCCITCSILSCFFSPSSNLTEYVMSRHTFDAQPLRRPQRAPHRPLTHVWYDRTKVIDENPTQQPFAINQICYDINLKAFLSQ
jgi:hypothetical protein